jgi:hypothetical protein
VIVIVALFEMVRLLNSPPIYTLPDKVILFDMEVFISQPWLAVLENGGGELALLLHPEGDEIMVLVQQSESPHVPLQPDFVSENVKF